MDLCLIRTLIKTKSMIGSLLTLLGIIFILNLNAQVNNPEYDSTLARKLGADERGMKSYVLVILKTGPAIIEKGAKRDSLFAGHFSNMDRLAAAGKLIIAGPIGSNDKSYRGIFILNSPTLEEAREILKSDPTIKAGIFDIELYEWYGSAAISEYLKVAEKIVKNRK